MGSGPSLADNQEVEHQSGASRLCESIFCAVCIAPLLILAMTFTVGWNEHRAVCEQKAIDAGSGMVHAVGCSSTSMFNNELVMLTCDVQNKNLPSLSIGGDFGSQSVQGVGVKVKAEMLQCVEKEHSETKKDKGGGGGTTTIKTYTYKTEWRDSPVNSASFHKPNSNDFRRNCGAANPSWPSDLPKSKSQYAPQIQVGDFKITDAGLISNIPLETPVSSLKAPSGWQGSSGSFQTTKWETGYNGIGKVRMSVYTNDWNSPTVTVAGNNNNGQIGAWKAPASWLCSGSNVHTLKVGSFSKDALFAKLSEESSTMTWILRIVGFVVLWFAFSLCFGPLGVVADCIPCIGPILGDSIEAITCCISCLPATACFLGVAGIMWCAMRPLVGIPLIILWVAVMFGFGYYIRKARMEKKEGLSTSLGPPNPSYGTTQLSTVAQGAPPPAFAAPGMAQPMAQQIQPVAAPVVAQPVVQQVQPQRQMQVIAPVNSAPGTMVQVQTPDGTMVQVAVPQGVAPGTAFLINY